jgi:hypothetical protein
MATRPFIGVVVRSTTPTTTGQVTYERAGIGTPSGAIFLVTVPTTEDVEEPELRISWGVTNGSRERAAACYSENGAGTTNCGNAGTESGCILLLNEDSSAIDMKASFVAWTDDGVTIDYTTAGDAPYSICVVLLAGDECLVDVGTAQGTGNPISFATQNPQPGAADSDFEADFVLMAGAGTTDETISAHMHAAFGISVNDGGPSNGLAMAWAEDSKGTTNTRRYYANDKIGRREGASPAPGFINDIFISDYFLGGFTVTADNATNPIPVSFWIAVKCSSDGSVGVAMTNDDTPVSTGTEAYTWPGFRTGLLYTACSANNNVDSWQTAAAVGLGVVETRTDAQFSMSVRDRRGVGSTQNGMFVTTAAMHTYNHTGATLLYRAVFDSIDATGHTLDFTDHGAGNPRHFSALAIEYPNFIGGHALKGGLNTAGAKVGSGNRAGVVAATQNAAGAKRST